MMKCRLKAHFEGDYLHTLSFGLELTIYAEYNLQFFRHSTASGHVGFIAILL